MALHVLLNTSECGPSNPLKNLSKRFDQDRGIQQDHFGPTRSRTANQHFRTPASSSSTFNEEAESFFSANQKHQPLPFDLSVFRDSLPTTTPHVQQASWVADFMQSPPPQMMVNGKPERQIHQDQELQQPVISQSPLQGLMPPHMAATWNPIFSPNNFIPTIQSDQSLWDQVFQSQENALTSQVSAHPPAVVLTHLENQISTTTTVQRQSTDPQDELARTAGLLVDSVKDESNPKFQNSTFMGLMKQLRDGAVVVEGNQMVEASSTTHLAAKVDIKGKSRAVLDPGPSTLKATFHGQTATTIGEPQQEDPNDAYFRQENEDFVRFWTGYHSDTVPLGAPSSDSAAWDNMQQEWDRFEATSTGIKAIDDYQFQINNPYLMGDSSRTPHTLRTDGLRKNVYESVLELEASVQRDPTDPKAWFELGVKQQENEREHKAIQALERALDLDPTHLPSWLALSVSQTNEGNRTGTYNAIRQWVDRNGQYASVLAQHHRKEPEHADHTAATKEEFDRLVECLIAMARSDGTKGEINADVQIALAIILNTNEEYGKAQDCFRTALEVRPDDWLLYNRVGATMANSGHAEEALQYYYRALELNPAYIRARFNLGISCGNLRRYEEAAQHLLDALVLQDSDGIRDPQSHNHQMNDAHGVTSDALWNALKTTCLHMQRIELASLCDMRDLDGFRDAFQG